MFCTTHVKIQFQRHQMPCNCYLQIPKHFKRTDESTYTASIFNRELHAVGENKAVTVAPILKASLKVTNSNGV